MTKTPGIAPPKPKKGGITPQKSVTAIASKKSSSQKSVTAAKNAVTKAQQTLARKQVRVGEAKKRLDTFTKATEVITTDVGLLTTDMIEALPPVPKQIAKEKEPLFKPNPGPQTDFLSANEKFVFYGGARGGGKSAALIVDPLPQCHHPQFKGLILRRTMPELRDLIHNSHRLYDKAYPGAKWREQEKEWRFPSGATIEFGYAETEQDTLRYQGREYTWIGIDELPQYPGDWIITNLKGSLRSPAPDLKTYFRATGNPGNIGSPWVRAMFIDAAPPNTRFTKEITLDNGEHVQETYRFIPATVYDNPHLMRDNSYVTMLASLPEYKKRQWLYGDWDVYDGAAFPEFDRKIHVIPAFPIHSNWPKFRAADWGYASPACVLWFTIDPATQDLFVYRELYTKGKTADIFARLVMEMESGENIRYGVLDASAWASRGEVGPSVAETMIREGCRWRPSDRSKNSRVNGKIELHRRLAINEATGEPRIKIFDNCTNIIRTLPRLPVDENNQEDVDTDAEDHAYDALRYGVHSRPLAVDMPWDLNNPTRTGDFAPASNSFGY